MRKLCSVLLAAVCMLQCAFLLSACGDENPTEDDADGLFNFRLIDEYTYLGAGSEEYLEQGTYILVSLNRSREIPKTLILPSEHDGIRVTAVGSQLLSFTSVETIVFPETIKAVGQNLCGSTCPTLKNIVCMGLTPFYLVSFAMDQTQRRGACKIYAPDMAVNYYKEFSAGDYPFSRYSDLIEPYSVLDPDVRAEIETTISLPSQEEITFTATFVADGETVAARKFVAFDAAIEDEPEVPEVPCAEYAYWEDYKLRAEDITIHAVYEGWHHSIGADFHCVVCGGAPSGGEIIRFGSFEQDNDLENGKEALEWLVLKAEGEKLLCVTKYAIAGKYYTDSVSDVKPWNECPLRIWLNTEFVETAFEEGQKSRLLVEPRESEGMLYSDDKVFLLNAVDVAFTYCPPNGQFRSQPTPYAVSQGVTVDWKGDCSCWLFANGIDQAATICNENGNNGGFANYVPHEIHGVRPVIWLDISKAR